MKHPFEPTRECPCRTKSGWGSHSGSQTNTRIMVADVDGYWHVRGLSALVGSRRIGDRDYGLRIHNSGPGWSWPALRHAARATLGVVG
jgi:hypothetical protein